MQVAWLRRVVSGQAMEQGGGGAWQGHGKLMWALDPFRGWEGCGVENGVWLMLVSYRGKVERALFVCQDDGHGPCSSYLCLMGTNQSVSPGWLGVVWQYTYNEGVRLAAGRSGLRGGGA